MECFILDNDVIEDNFLMQREGFAELRCCTRRPWTPILGELQSSDRGRIIRDFSFMLMRVSEVQCLAEINRQARRAR